MTQKSSVLIFTTAYRPLVGGSEIALQEIIRRLPNIFFDILTPKYRPGLAVKENFENGCVHRIGIGSPLDKFLFPVSGFIAALKLRPKIIHAYQASFGAGAAVIYKTFFPKVRFILTLQEGKDLNRQNILIKYFRNLIIRKADVVTAISHYLADYAKKINPKAELHIIPNGVDLGKFTIHESRITNHEKVVITVSRLVKKNGIGDLIDAMAVVRNEIPDAKLTIIGSGPLEKILKLKVRSLNLENYIEFLGEISNELLPKCLSMANIFVRPSLSEGLGTAFLEAMAAGLPVVGTAVGGIPDFLKDKQTGLFCKPGDPDDIADKIIMLLENDELRNRLAGNGRRLVEEKYDWEKIASEFAKLYQEINVK